MTMALRTILALFLAAAAAGAQNLPQQNAQQPGRRPVSLREALQLTARQGPDVAAARAQAAVAQASVRKAWTAWQPDISANGTLDHTNATAQIPGGVFGPNPITIVAQNSRYATIQIAQPLLSPQGLFGPSAASAGAEAAARGADEAREQTLLATARTYLGLQGLEGLLQAAHEAEKVALAREKDARAQIAAGTAVEISLLRAQTETAAARVQIANLEGQRDSLLPLLEALTGEPIQPGPQMGDDLRELTAEAQQPWEQSFAVRSAAAAVRAGEGAVRLDNFAWMPTVAGVARENYNSNGGFAGRQWTWDLLLTVNVPLYDRGMRYAQRAEDTAKLSQAQAQLASARARARAAWLGGRANLSSAQASLEQAQIQAELAVRAQKQVDASYRAGVATSLDLSDADQKKFLAESALAQARAALETRKAEIAAAEGRLYSSVAQ